MKNTVKFLGLLFFIAACKTETEQRIVGKWQATQLMECDNMIPIQTELVDIEFMSNGNYVFHSTLNVKEEGTYRLKKNYLFTQDKLREKAPEKAVLIKLIDQDSLVLQMSYKGKDQYLFLVKDGVKEKNKTKEDAASKTDGLVASTAATAAAVMVSNPINADSIKQAEAGKSAKAEEEKKKQAEADKAAERKKEEAAADKKREAEADRKREEAKKKSKKEDSGSSSEAYKKREAKRKEAEKDAKREAEKKAEKFRKEYAKREAENKKKKK